MKKLFLYFTAIFSICCFVTACGDNGESESPTVIGNWTTIERTIKTDDSNLDDRMNYLFKEETGKYNIVRSFTDKNADTQVETVITNKETGALVRKTQGNFRIEGDSLFVDDEIFGGTTRSGVLLSNNVLVTTRKVSIAEIKIIAQQLGIPENLLPKKVDGVFKIKEVR